MTMKNSFVSDAKVNATIDGINEDVFKIIDDQFNEQANPVGFRKINLKLQLLIYLLALP